MKKKFRKLILPVSILAATQSIGLGLGGLQVDSNLDEALKGKIPLIINEDETSDNIKVSLANEKDYQRVGLDKSYVPSNIKVSLEEKNGEKFIKIYSKGPVSEPIVSLLLVVDWANGHLLREFTLLLDPPLFNQNSAANKYTESVQTQKYQAPTKIEERASEDNSSNQVNYSSTISESSYNNSQQVTVESGDTLWKIAKRNRNGYGTTQQVMVAIFNNNPSAFLNDDMNLLRKGAILTIPDSDQISSIPNSQAISEVREQTRQWSHLQSQNSHSDSSKSSDIDYGIELVPPNDNENSNNAEGSSSSSTINTKLSAQLSQAQERLASSALQSSELTNRVQELEKIIKDQELALLLKDTNLAQLQQQLTDGTDKVEDDVWNNSEKPSSDELASTDESTLTDEEISTDELTFTDEETSTGQLATADKIASTNEETSVNEKASIDEGEIKDSKPAQEITKPSKSNQEVSFMDKVISFKNEILVGFGALLLALVGFFFIKKRNKSESNTENDSFLDEISDSNETLSNLNLDSIESEVDDKIEKELNLSDNDFNLNDEFNDETELNLTTLEEEVVSAVDKLDIEKEPDVIVMDDEVDLDLDLDLDLENLENQDFDDNEPKNNDTDDFQLDEDTLDELDLNLDLDDDLSLDLDLDNTDAIEFEIDTEANEALKSDENRDSDELDFGDDLDLSLDDIDFGDSDNVIDLADGEIDLIDESLELSEDDTIQSAIEELGNEPSDSLDLISQDESIDDLDIGFDLDDVVDDTIDTKIDLARAYFEMGDVEGAKQMVEEVIEEGTQEQKNRAQELQSEIKGS